MQQTITITTPVQNGLYDITGQVETIVAESGVQTGMVNVYAQGGHGGYYDIVQIHRPSRILR